MQPCERILPFSALFPIPPSFHKVKSPLLYCYTKAIVVLDVLACFTILWTSWRKNIILCSSISTEHTPPPTCQPPEYYTPPISLDPFHHLLLYSYFLLCIYLIYRFYGPVYPVLWEGVWLHQRLRSNIGHVCIDLELEQNPQTSCVLPWPQNHSF